MPLPLPSVTLVPVPSPICRASAAWQKFGILFGVLATGWWCATTGGAVTDEPAAGPSVADLMRDVKAPEGFEATVFAGPDLARYPVFVAATVDGTLFVSSDGNGSLDREPHRGRILRLRDTDGDGTAD